MSTDTYSGIGRDDGSLVRRAGSAIRKSFFLSLATFGAVLLLAGYGCELLWMIGRPIENGVIAGMLGIWGGTALLVGGFGYVSLWCLRRR